MQETPESKIGSNHPAFDLNRAFGTMFSRIEVALQVLMIRLEDAHAFVERHAADRLQTLEVRMSRCLR
jgi:hypothetical protein